MREDRGAYNQVSQLALAHLADHGDPAVARIARAMADGMPRVARSPHRARGETRSERLERIRELACATPFDRHAFEDAVAGVEECAEKRYLMAVAAYRAADGGTVPMSAVEDLERAMQLDPGNAEYVAFARVLADHLGSEELERAIADERELIRALAARGVSATGSWV